MKIVFGAAFAAFALLAFSASAPAQSVDAIVKRLEALEKENSTLRQRVHRLEAGKQRVASAQASAPVATATPAPLYNSPAMTAQASVNKAPMSMMMMPSTKWNGFYIGAHGGYAFSKWLPPTPNTGLASNLQLQGGFGGIQAGYNIQLAPHWLIGVEQDVSIGRISATQSQPYPAPTITGQTNAFGTVRGRFGYIWNDISAVRDRRHRLGLQHGQAELQHACPAGRRRRRRAHLLGIASAMGRGGGSGYRVVRQT